MTMIKRPLDDSEDCGVPKKRPRHSSNRLDRLSDELLLRTFSFLAVPTLCLCQRVSRRFSDIAGDSQIWKQLYYNDFVRPRAARLPGLRDSPSTNSHLHFSSKLSKWLDEDNLVRRGKETNWKRQYKLRDNWTRGQCKVSEIDVAEEPPTPELLVRLHHGVLYTVDRRSGLRAWSCKKERHLLATTALDYEPSSADPTSLAVDVSDDDDSRSRRTSRLVVGFSDGRFIVYSFDRDTATFRQICGHSEASKHPISAVAFASAYLLTMTSRQQLRLYKLPSDDNQEAPRLLHSLRAQLLRPPLSLCVRPSGSTITVSIAYQILTLTASWAVGIQEVKLSGSGELLDSRVATASSDFQESSATPRPTSYPLTLPTTPNPRVNAHFRFLYLSGEATSVSYSHPYLLLSHADNTLTLHLVTSTASSLSIGEGSRLWGHTSSVSGVQVGGRGKAVSVSSYGDEFRIWELEGASASLSPARKRRHAGQLSVRVQPAQWAREPAQSLEFVSNALALRGTGLGLAMQETKREMGIMQGWVGFDEENVAALEEKVDGRQALVVFDFT